MHSLLFLPIRGGVAKLAGNGITATSQDRGLLCRAAIPVGLRLVSQKSRTLTQKAKSQGKNSHGPSTGLAENFQDERVPFLAWKQPALVALDRCFGFAGAAAVLLQVHGAGCGSAF